MASADVIILAGVYLLAILLLPTETLAEIKAWLKSPVKDMPVWQLVAVVSGVFYFLKN